jgi:carbon-monoxide dehydrogenase medium subunit
MKPRPFDYCAPRSLDEALALLAAYGPEARPLAGGQSLVQRMNLRQESPAVIVDLNRVPELDFRQHAADGALVIGAMTRQQRLVDDVTIRAANPALADVAAAVAFPAVRSRGTLGGNVANAEPGAQLPLLLSVLDAQATIARRDGQRSSPVAALFAGAGVTTLAPDELLIALAVPPLGPTVGVALQEFRRGHSGPPLISVVAVVAVNASGAISAAHVGISGISAVPLRLPEAGAALVGQTTATARFAPVADQAAGLVSRGDPLLADTALRQRATRALVTRALAAALAHAVQRGNKEAGA